MTNKFVSRVSINGQIHFYKPSHIMRPHQIVPLHQLQYNAGTRGYLDTIEAHSFAQTLRKDSQTFLENFTSGVIHLLFSNLSKHLMVFCETARKTMAFSINTEIASHQTKHSRVLYYGCRKHWTEHNFQPAIPSRREENVHQFLLKKRKYITKNRNNVTI